MSATTVTVHQYHRMIETGVLGKDDKVELLDGWIIVKAAKTPLRSCVTGLIRDEVQSMLPDGFLVISHDAVTLPTSEPEPALSIIRGELQMFGKRHPIAPEAVLFVEVSDTTLAHDRGSKKRIYAQAGIPQYWIVNLVERQIEVYREPDAAAGDYRQPTVYGVDDDVHVNVDGTLIGTLKLAQRLPGE